MSGLMLSYADAVVAGPVVVGGKGWNLGRLDRYGFPVPAGGVLAASVYSELMACSTLRGLRMDLADILTAAVEDPAVGAKLAVLRAAIISAPLPAAAVGAVRAFLQDARLHDKPLAVRSSATAEDSAAASFAGMHQSVLNVTGVENVERAIKECYASLWTPRAIAYRRHLGLRDEAVACAVVICAMASGPEGEPPIAAGIGFSCDPRTGRRDRVAISAVAGLAEPAVLGRVNPEEIIVTLRDGLPSGVDRVSQGASILPDDQTRKLADLLLRVQWALGDGQEPQDVEWVYDGQQFWLVQARPIAHLPRATFPAIASLPVIWSNALVKDAIPGVLTPLSWSTLRPGFRSVASFGDDIAQLEGQELLRRFHGRVYVDMTSVYWSVYDTLGVTPRRLTQNLLDQPPVISVPPHPLRRAAGLRRMFAMARLVASYVQLAHAFPRESARIHAAAQSYRTRDLRPLDGAGLVLLYQQVAGLMADSMRRFRLNHLGIWNVLLRHVLEHYRPGRGQALASNLMADIGQLASADPGYRLLDLAMIAAQDPQARAYLETQPLDPQGWRDLPVTSPFGQALSIFLDEFGHRGLYEAELANPRWSEDPSYLLEQIRLLLPEERRVSSQETARATRKAAEVEVSRLPLVIRPAVRWLAGQARQAAARREAGRSAFIAVGQALRRLALEAGARMAAAGVLDTPADVFYLTSMDVAAYFSGAWDGKGARMLVADRRAQCEAWLDEAAPEFIVLDAEGRPFPLVDTQIVMPVPQVAKQVAIPSATPLPAGGVTLRGVGAAAGRASGRACVMRRAREGARLQAGDILVAPSTDPGWTPLFLRAGAVVTEAGGYLSHGAIVAREYGIPAVVNVPDLLATIEDGQYITVDGDGGNVIC